MSQKEEVIEDFLENDNEIPGQKYCCISFISPENVLEQKQVFFVHKFLETIAKNYDLDRNKIQEKYKDFLYINEEKLQSEFNEQNDFRTSVRGVKIRGSYDSLKEAEVRAKVLQRKDRNHNVFVGQVGFWLPWDPSSHRVENQEYMESELNTLVKKYKENQEKKDIHFQENIDYVKEQEAKKNKDIEDARKKSEISEVESSLEEMDPWLKNKQENKE